MSRYTGPKDDDLVLTCPHFTNNSPFVLVGITANDEYHMLALCAECERIWDGGDVKGYLAAFPPTDAVYYRSIKHRVRLGD